jgi:regulator of protease activity HflC (stomatin/prohibitin superfamily)
MEHNAGKTGAINWVTLLLVTVVAAGLARMADSATGITGVVFLGLGVLVTLVSYLQMRLEARERVEQLEFDELKKAKGGASLFVESVDSFAARRSREQFEKYLIPAFTGLLFVLQGVAAWLLWRWLDGVNPPRMERTTLTMALFAIFFLVLFLLGKYSANLARMDGQQLLRPGAGYLLLGAVICLLVAAAEGAALAGFGRLDLYLARALTVLLGLTAIETLAGLVLEIYRPRVKGRAGRLMYESRLIGLLGQPGGLVTTAAQALDYQFGFKVSETWVYKFLEKALAWIILLQLGVLGLSTTFVIIEPTEQGLIERFGRRVESRPVLEAGLHFKWPWPIDQVRIFETRKVHTITLGVVPDPDLEREMTVLWTRPHYAEEYNMLVASGQTSTSERSGEKAVPANLLAASIPVQYQVTNVVAWAYQHADAGVLLEQLASREVVRYLVNTEFEVVMSTGRLVAAQTLQRRIQARVDEAGLGAQIVFVGLQGVHPPIGNRTAAVAAAFEQVVSAIQHRETNILAAQAYALGKLPLAMAEATNLLNQARSASVLKVATAEAEATSFAHQVRSWESSPSVFSQKSYLDTLVRAIGPVRKYVLAATNTQDVLILNLEDEIRADLLRDVVLPPSGSQRPGAGQ